MKEKLKESVKSVLAQKGMSEKEINDFLERSDRPGRESSTLPKSGKFIFDATKHVAGEGQFLHLRVGVEKQPDTCSVSRLKAVGLMGDQPPRFREVTREGSPLKGSYVLLGTAVNPLFSRFSPFDLVNFLNGREFEAEPINIKVLPYVDGGHANPSESDLIIQTAYKITLKWFIGDKKDSVL